jgi:hypothetical protein
MYPRHTLLLCMIVYFAAACCRDKTATTLPVEPEIRSLMPYTNGQAIVLQHGADTLALRVEAYRDSIELACDGDCCERFFQGIYLIKLKQTDNTNFAEMTASSNAITFDAINTRFAAFGLNENKQIVCDQAQGILCLDSLVVGAQTYRNLWRIAATNTTAANSPKFLYYNKTNGIVKIDMQDGIDYLLR